VAHVASLLFRVTFRSDRIDQLRRHHYNRIHEWLP